MIDVFYEETIRPSDGVKAGKKYKRTLLLSRFFLFSALMFTFLLFIMFYTPFNSQATLTDMLLSFLPTLILCIISYTLYFVLKNKKHVYLVDYDYTFISGELRIAKVLNGLKRRPVAKIQSNNISVLGKISSDKYLRYKTMQGIKIITATPNAETANENLYFAVCMYEGVKSLLIFEPSPNLVYNIKKFAGRTVEYVV